MNLNNASITTLETGQFTALRVFTLAGCRLKELNTIPLINLVFLQIQDTNIIEIRTETLSKLEFLNANST